MKLNFLAVLAALPVALAAIAFPVDDPAQGKDFTTERKCASGERRCHRWAVEMCLGGSWKRLQTCPWPMTCEYRTPRRGGAAQPTCIGTLHALGDVDADTDASDHDLLVVAANSPVPDLETRQSFSPPSPCHYGDMACSKDLYSVMVCDKNDKWQVQLKCPKPGCCATYPNGMPYCECGPGMPPPGAEHAAEVEKREDSSDQVCPHSCYMDWWGCKGSPAHCKNPCGRLECSHTCHFCPHGRHLPEREEEEVVPMEPQLEALSERDDARIIPPPPNNCPRCQERVQNCILLGNPKYYCATICRINTECSRCDYCKSAAADVEHSAVSKRNEDTPPPWACNTCELNYEMCRQYNGKRPDAECREEICNPETSPLTYSCGHCQRCGGYVAPELEMETPPQQRDFERAPAVKREEVPELAQEQGQCASDCFGKYMMCRTPPLANWGKCKSRYCRLDKCHECRFCHEDIAKREDVSGSEPAVKRVEAPELAQEQGVCACFGPFMNCVRNAAKSPAWCRSHFCGMAKCHNCDFCPNNAAKRDELSEPAAVVAEDEEAPELADVEGQCAKGCFTSYMACMRRPDGNIKVCRGAMCRSQCLKCSFCKHPDA